MGRRHPRVIAGLALAALGLAGCGEDPAIDKGLVPFKGTDTSSLEPLRSDMMKNMRTRAYLKKGGGSEPAAVAEGPGGSTLAPGSTSAGEPGPAPAAGARPAGESKPGPAPEAATRGG